jgi:glycogen operon protein
MLLGGDELGRTQKGNNNTYCQDNDLSWYDWSAVDESLIDFTAALVRLRMSHATFRRPRYFQGMSLRGTDLRWLTPAGVEMTPENWLDPFVRCVGAWYTADAFDERDRRGKPITDDDFLLLLNAHYEAIEFKLPEQSGWRAIVDTARGLIPRHQAAEPQQERYVIEARSLALLTRTVP